MSEAAQSESGESHTSDLELFEQYLDQDMSMEQPDRGDLRRGIIVEIRPSELVVDIGSKRDGVVPQSDLQRLDKTFVEELHVGQEIDVVVAKQSDDDGIFQLSMSDALQQRDWLTAEELQKNGQTTEHKVVGYNKGGLTVEFHRLRGFVPASHILDMPRNLPEDQRQAEFEKHIGQVMRLKVIEVDRKRRRLVMSQMLAEREYRAGRKDELFRTLKVGEVLSGEVRSLRPFGAFVDLGGADGLLHVSEIGWTPINHPREALEVGQKVDVQVIRLDPENQRIALSRKRVLANPWETVEQRYQPGQVLPATITRTVDFGAFAQLEPGVEGLIHISELADISVADPLHSVRPGEKVMVKVLRVDGKRQRIGLQRRMVDQGVLGEQAGAAAPAVEELADEDAPFEYADELAADTALSTASDAVLDTAVEVPAAVAPASELDATVENADVAEATPADAIADAGADAVEAVG
ncbi:MAG: S1 RNA-binding domain-containing protein, partial [Caldilineaceae bacterium]